MRVCRVLPLTPCAHAQRGDIEVVPMPRAADLAMVPVPKTRRATLPCASCGAPDATKRCPCQGPRYCNAACQKAHWKKEHKAHCLRKKKASKGKKKRGGGGGEA